MKILFHGSTRRGLKELRPFRNTTPGELKKEYVPESVYATDNPLAAVMFSFPWRSQDGVDIHAIENTLKLIIPAVHKERLEQPIALYKLDAKDFIPIPGVSQEIKNYWSHQIVTVLDSQDFPDVLSGIKSFGGLIEFV